jgi:hypothetical protein
LNQSEVIKRLGRPSPLMSKCEFNAELPEPVPRYYFNFRWPDDAVTDTEGVELESFADAYRHACGLVQQVRGRFSDADEDWWIEISDGPSGNPTVILPSMVPMPGPRARPD